MEYIEQIKETIEKLTGDKIAQVQPVSNITNNKVYKVETQKGRYFFKIYNSDWPEKGKPQFVNLLLQENGIACAKLIAFERSDPLYAGYLLEEAIEGTNAETFSFDRESGRAFYKKLAQLVSKIHKIKMENFGYIGYGRACWETFSEFISDEWDERLKRLQTIGLSVDVPYEVKQIVLANLRLCDSMPSVLCHGDLSAKNVIITKDEKLVLIDWDDAMSYPWVADFARLTYWMRSRYNEDEYKAYREAFVEGYQTDFAVRDLDLLEKSFHLFEGLSMMQFYAHSPLLDPNKHYFEEIKDNLLK